MTSALRPDDPRSLGPYELISRLGEGGMGAVFLARDEAGRSVAVKVIRAEYARDAHFRARFRSEVNRVREVPAFCTAEVLDADPDHETPYLVVEYVDGPSLTEIVRDRGPLRGGSLHSLAVGVASALVAIHSAGIIHRDLKPANVLFALGTPKVIDFGIAKAVEPTSNHTRTSEMVGTLAYMAPERFVPETDRRLTPAADIFAWGAVVAYAATGRSPFAGDNPAVTAARILTQPPELDGLPSGLALLVERCLAKDPRQRPSASELLTALLTAGDLRATIPAEVRRAAAGAQSTAILGGARPAVDGGARPARVPGAHRPSAAPVIRWPTERRLRLRLAGVAAAVFVLVAAGGAWAGLRLAGAGTPAEAAPTPQSTLVRSQTTTSIVDPLDQPGFWQSSGAPTEGCSFSGALVARTMSRVRCDWAPSKVFSDALHVQVKADIGANSCATVWFGVTTDGKKAYLVDVCQNYAAFEYHVDADLIRGDFRGSGENGQKLAIAAPGTHLIAVDVTTSAVIIAVDGVSIMSVVLSTRVSGTVTLGADTQHPGSAARVAFRDVQINAA